MVEFLRVLHPCLTFKKIKWKSIFLNGVIVVMKLCAKLSAFKERRIKRRLSVIDIRLLIYALKTSL